jgi:hypothetical protein
MTRAVFAIEEDDVHLMDTSGRYLRARPYDWAAHDPKGEFRGYIIQIKKLLRTTAPDAVAIGQLSEKARTAAGKHWNAFWKSADAPMSKSSAQSFIQCAVYASEHALDAKALKGLGVHVLKLVSQKATPEKIKNAVAQWIRDGKGAELSADDLRRWIKDETPPDMTPVEKANTARELVAMICDAFGDEDAYLDAFRKFEEAGPKLFARMWAEDAKSKFDKRRKNAPRKQTIVGDALESATQ